MVYQSNITQNILISFDMHMYAIPENELFKSLGNRLTDVSLVIPPLTKAYYVFDK